MLMQSMSGVKEALKLCVSNKISHGCNIVSNSRSHRDVELLAGKLKTLLISNNYFLMRTQSPN